MDMMLEHADSDFIRAEFLAIRTRQYATLGKMEASISCAIRGLRLLGYEVSDTPTLNDIAAERRSIDQSLYFSNRRRRVYALLQHASHH